MAMQICSTNSPVAQPLHGSIVHRNSIKKYYFHSLISRLQIHHSIKKYSIKCSVEESKRMSLRTCKLCKTQFDPSLNHPQACRFHSAHFGGETKRKFESVYSGGTMNTPGSGKVFQYWHCCGSEDPFDLGCTASPHSSYDD